MTVNKEDLKSITSNIVVLKQRWIEVVIIPLIIFLNSKIKFPISCNLLSYFDPI